MLDGQIALTPVGDLNGDGVEDLLDFRTVEHNYRTVATTITVRDGLTGEPEWHKVFGAGTEVTVRPIVAGSPARCSLLVLTEHAGVGYAEALSGGDGDVLWRTRVHAGFVGVLHDHPGPTDDVLFVGGHDKPFDQTAVPEVLDGVNGTLRSLPSVHTSGQFSHTTIQVVPGLRGRGDDDVLELVDAGGPPGAGEGLGSVVAVSAATGQDLWTATDLDVYDNLAVEPAPGLSGPGTTDLVFAASNDSLATPITYTVVTGRTGTTRWSRRASDIEFLGHVGSDSVPALGFLPDQPYDSHHGRTYARVTEIADRGSDGHEIWRTSRQISIPTVPGAKPRYGYAFDQPGFGDLQPDGSGDVPVQLLVRSGSHRREQDGVISGHDGRWLQRPYGEPTDGSLAAGAGTDILTGDQHGTKYSVTGYSGKTGHRYFTTTIHIADYAPSQLTATRLGHHPCSEPIISLDPHELFTNSRYPISYAVLSGSGQPLWTLNFNGDQHLGGQLHRYPSPRPFCAP